MAGRLDVESIRRPRGPLDYNVSAFTGAAVSWVPIVGWALPDETQRIPIRMKFAIVDVRSGQWDMFSLEPFEEVAARALYTRVWSDQAQVATLKDKAYKSTVEYLVKRYSK
jgi:hypothetical protein